MIRFSHGEFPSAAEKQEAYRLGHPAVVKTCLRLLEEGGRRVKKLWEIHRKMVDSCAFYMVSIWFLIFDVVLYGALYGALYGFLMLLIWSILYIHTYICMYIHIHIYIFIYLFIFIFIFKWFLYVII